MCRYIHYDFVVHNNIKDYASMYEHVSIQSYFFKSIVYYNVTHS